MALMKRGATAIPVVDLTPAPITIVDRSFFKRPAQDKKANLTPTQIEVIKWLMDGKRTEEIAVLMQMTQGAVRLHLYRIMEITGTNTRIATVVYALRHKVLDLPPLPERGKQ